jgi:hypothetical protein
MVYINTEEEPLSTARMIRYDGNGTKIAIFLEVMLTVLHRSQCGRGDDIVAIYEV